jgi:hypothetical protein
MDDARAKARDVVGSESEPGQRTRPVALKKDVRRSQRGSAIGIVAELGKRRALAAAGVGDGTRCWAGSAN